MRSFSGPYFPVFGLNTKIYGVNPNTGIQENRKSVGIQENKDQKKFRIWTLSRSVSFHKSSHVKEDLKMCRNILKFFQSKPCLMVATPFYRTPLDDCFLQNLSLGEISKILNQRLLFTEAVIELFLGNSCQFYLYYLIQFF